jgi:serine protease Do
MRGRYEKAKFAPASGGWRRPDYPARGQRSSLTLRVTITGILTIALCLSLAAPSHTAFAQQRPAKAHETGDGIAAVAALEQAFIRVIDEAENSVVSLARYRVPARAGFDLRNGNPFQPFRNADQNEDSTSGPVFVPNDFGAGIILAPSWNPADRMILTNYHVVRGGQVEGEPPADRNRIHARFANQRGCDLTIIAADPRSDLAVLKIDFQGLGVGPAALKPIRFATIESFRKGQIVLSLGNPYAIARDGSASASWGMISNIDRRPAPLGVRDEQTFRKETLHHFGTLLQIDNRLDLGSSGGAVLNLKGELIGIATSLAALEGYEKSVGYAVPMTSATRRIVESLMHGHEVEYGFLGVTPSDAKRETLLTKGYATIEQPSAAVVQTVFEQSPAHRAGLQKDDVILDVDGHPVYNADDLVRYIGQLGPGVDVTLRVCRKKRKDLNVVVALGKWPVQDDENIIATVPRYPEWRGLSVDYPTARYRYFQSSPQRYFQAVLVAKIDEKSIAARSGLKEGDFISHVNDTPVTTPAEFEQAVRGQAGDVRLALVERPPVVLHAQ